MIMNRFGRVFAVLVIVALSSIQLSAWGWGKKDPDYNKSPEKWYNDIRKSLSHDELEKADKQFLSLRSEHMDSAYIPAVEMILAQAHLGAEEYLLAAYYLDEYLKKYGRGARGEYARYLKIKAAFLGIKDINKDQKLVIATLKQAKSFYASHRGSRYAPLVQTMIVRLEMAQYLLNEDIASLYDRIGKEPGAKLYREKNKKFIYKEDQIEPPKGGFLSKINPF